MQKALFDRNDAVRFFLKKPKHRSSLDDAEGKLQFVAVAKRFGGRYDGIDGCRNARFGKRYGQCFVLCEELGVIRYVHQIASAAFPEAVTHGTNTERRRHFDRQKVGKYKIAANVVDADADGFAFEGEGNKYGVRLAEGGNPLPARAEIADGDGMHRTDERRIHRESLRRTTGPTDRTISTLMTSNATNGRTPTPRAATKVVPAVYESHAVPTA